MTPEDLVNQYNQVNHNINQFCEDGARRREDVSLIAVSKRHPAWKITGLIKLGQQDFAENYLQEGIEKIAEVKATTLSPESCASPKGFITPIWHFIGHIQSRKCKDIAANFDWVHTVESEKVARKLNQYREHLPALNVHIQINLQQEASKSGISADSLDSLAGIIDELPNLKLRGLMIIPRSEADFKAQFAVFRQCRSLLEKLVSQGYQVDQLSMGMSDDLRAAIAAGATQVRIGTAIFGPRAN